MRLHGATALVGLSVAACSPSVQGSPEPFEIVGDTIPTPLTTVIGNADLGQSIFKDRDSGHCVLCHAIDGLQADFQGNLGPALSDVGARLTEGQIRLRIVDPTRLNSDTVMPAYYKTDGLHQVAHGFKDKPVLSAEEIEHVVAYLSKLEG
ncbi:MAG: sulfur oxidation c-type cytochrome SoxX [Pseudomonadota bacterium]